MKKNPAAKKIDFVLLTLALMLVMYILFLFVFDNAAYSIIMALLTLSVIYLIYFKAKSVKNKRAKITAEDTALKDKIFFNLPYMNESALNAFITKLLIKSGYSPKNYDKILTATKNNKTYYVRGVFKNAADKNEIFKSEHNRRFLGADGFILFCADLDKNAAQAAKTIANKDNYIIEKDSFFCIMKKYNSYPPALIENKQIKTRFKEIFFAAFERKRFKGYFFLGLIMFSFSFITPFKIYYLAFSALLLTFSAISLIKKPQKPAADISIF